MSTPIRFLRFSAPYVGPRFAIIQSIALPPTPACSLVVLVVVRGSVLICQQENIRMQSTIHAQESLIGGLKAERRLWGQELAQQGEIILCHHWRFTTLCLF